MMKTPLERIYVVNILSELVFTTSRSGGPGGQSVNKVNTKVTLRWDVAGSQLANEEQKEKIMLKLAKMINKERELVLSAEGSRSQLQNKQEALDKLDILLNSAFYTPKIRKKTKPTKSSIKKRLASKKKHSEKKTLRKKLDE